MSSVNSQNPTLIPACLQNWKGMLKLGENHLMIYDGACDISIS